VTANITWLCKVIRERTGIVLGIEKIYLIESRLHNLVMTSREKSLDDFLGLVRTQPWGNSFFPSPRLYQGITII
jgi:chemotaxis methyl-accepting protein methylase